MKAANAGFFRLRGFLLLRCWANDCSATEMQESEIL
jgi:hypothetical protein